MILCKYSHVACFGRPLVPFIQNLCMHVSSRAWAQGEAGICARDWRLDTGGGGRGLMCAGLARITDPLALTQRVVAVRCSAYATKQGQVGNCSKAYCPSRNYAMDDSIGGS